LFSVLKKAAQVVKVHIFYLDLPQRIKKTGLVKKVLTNT